MTHHKASAYTTSIDSRQTRERIQQLTGEWNRPQCTVGPSLMRGQGHSRKFAMPYRWWGVDKGRRDTPVDTGNLPWVTALLEAYRRRLLRACDCAVAYRTVAGSQQSLISCRLSHHNVWSELTSHKPLPLIRDRAWSSDHARRWRILV